MPSLHLPWFPLALAIFMASTPAPAQVPALRGAVPDEAVLVVEMEDPAAAVGELLHAIGDVPPGLAQLLGPQAWLALATARIAIDGDPVAFARQAAGGGALLAIVPAANGVQSVALLRPQAPEVLAKWLARWAATVPHEVVAGTFVIGADRGLVHRTATRVAAGGGRWAKIELGEGAPVRGAVDLAAIRRAVATKLPTLQTLDAGARFLLLPLAHAALAAELATFALVGGDRLLFRARANSSVRNTPAGRLLTGAASHPVVPLPEGGLATFRLERCLRTLLQTPEQFLRPDEVLAVQGFLSIADAIDGPRSSFVDDLIGGLGEPLTLHVLPITPPLDGPPPRLQLPGFAVVTALTDPKAEAVLFRAAEALFLISNAERAQRGQVLFPARSRRTEAGRGLVGEPTPWRGPGAPPVEQALSPTVWCENGYVVLASTQAAAMAVIAAAKSPVSVTPSDTLLLRVAEWAPVLAASRSVLELGRVLDEGEGPIAAAHFFDVLTTVAAAVRELSLSVHCDASTTAFELTLARVR